MHSSPNALRPRSPISERTEKAPNFQQNSLIDNGRIIPQMLMYGICTYIYPRFKPNVGKYEIHGAYGYLSLILPSHKAMAQHIGPASTTSGPISTLHLPLDSWGGRSQLHPNVPKYVSPILWSVFGTLEVSKMAFDTHGVYDVEA